MDIGRAIEAQPTTAPVTAEWSFFRDTHLFDSGVGLFLT